jgi:hypothetical protein
MDDTEFAQRRKTLEDELSELERAAGIAPEAAEKAWDLAFIPYGIMGDEMSEFTAAQNNTLYFDNEHDDRARRVRNLYFGIADAEARTKLIAKVLELDDLRDRSCRDDVEKAKRAVWQAQQRETDLRWFAAATWGVGCVLVGYWIGNLVGAIAGAVAGVFLGMRMVFEMRKKRRAAVMSATEEVATAGESLQQLLTRPRFFTPIEATTGEKDDSYFVDAFGGRVREFRNASIGRRGSDVARDAC